MKPNLPVVDRALPNASSVPLACSFLRVFALAAGLLLACGLARATPTISITSPTTGSTLTVSSSPPAVTINATTAIGSSPGGTLVSKVEFFVNSVSIGSVGGGAFGAHSITWNPTATGSYTLTAVVTDTSVVTTGTSPNLNTATSPLVVVTVTGFGPSVTLTNPTNASSLGLGASVNLTATASATGSATVSRVDFLSGTTVIGSAVSSPYSVSWTPSVAGSTSLTARVTDSAGFTATSSAAVVNITVPSVTLTSPLSGSGVTLGLPTTLQATASAVSPATVSKVDFLVGGTLVGSSTTSPYNFSWTPSTAGSASITARVTDSNGAAITSAASTVTVSGAPAPTVSITAPSTGAIVSVGANVSVTASATAGSGATVSQVQFLVGGSTVIGTVTAAPYTVNWVPPSAGNYSLSARVIDSNNSSTTSAAVSVTAVAATTVSLTAPAANSSATVGSPTTVTAAVSPSAGSTISSVAFFANGVAIGSAVTTSPYSVSWTPTAAGTVQLTARATDSLGNTVTSTAVSVSVTDPAAPAIALTLSPGAAPATTLPAGSTRYALATVTPAAGRAVVRVEFFVDGTKVGESTAAPYVYRYTAPAAAGSYTLLARVTDNAGLTRDAQLSLTVVSAVGQPPTATLISPANNSTAIPGTAISLAATALASGGGSIANVQFYANGAVVGNPVTTSPYTASFTPTAPGTYAIQAVATDDRGNTTVSNTANVTAAFTAPAVTVTAPTGTVVAPTRATPGVPFTLSATATPGSGASVLLVEFYVGGTFVGSRTTPTTTGGTTYSFAWTPTTAQLGVAPVTARVTDTNSLTTTSNPTYVNVAVVTTPPPAVSGVGINPVPALGVQTLSTANFVATVAPGNTTLTISSVEFFLTDGVTPFKIGNGVRETTTGNLYRLVYGLDTFDYTAVTPNANGAYPLQLFVIARDNTGVQTQSALVNVTLNPSTSAPPTIQVAAVGGTTIAQGNTFQLAALPTDSDGNVASIQLYSNGVTSGAAQLNPTNGGVATFNFTPTAAGTYRLFVAATDDTGNTNISSVVTLTVTATAAPVVTLNRPADNSTVTTAGAPTYLEATVTLADQTLTPTVQFTVSGSGGRTVPSITATRVGTTTTYRGIFTNATADTYTIGVTASVAGGTVTGTSAVTRTVQLVNPVGNVPLVSAITTLGSAQTSSTVAFLVTATDGDGSIASVEFFLNRNSLGFADRQQLTNLWRMNGSFAGLTAGTYEVQAIARDNAGNAAASAILNLAVTTSTSAPPLLRIAATPLTVAFNQTSALTSTASDADGTITQVQYYSNGALIATSTTAPTFGANFTGTAGGSFTVFAIATDNTGNTAISSNLTLKVLPNNPLLDDTAFILQTSTDLSNATPSAVQLAAFQAQFASGALTRPQFAAAVATNNGAFNNTNFNNVTNALIAYWVLMGQWPTSTNYTTIFNARGNLANVCNAIINSPEYLIKYGATPTAALLNNPNGVLPAATFLARLHAGAGLPGPSQLEVLRFMSNDTANASLGIGRGYAAVDVNSTATPQALVGLPTAIAEFITITNNGNTALINLGRTAALYYQLDRPTVVTPQDALLTTNTVSTISEVIARVANLSRLASLTAVADAVLNDTLYAYRYVTITKQPQPLAIAARSGAIFSVEALGAPPISYQWLQNGAPIAGATASSLYLTNVTQAQAGTYSVVVTTSAGSATSDPALLTLSTAPTRLGNLSSRGVAGTGANVLTAGFVVTGTATKQMLIRVVGPSLAALGISGFLPNPSLDVLNSAGVSVASNDNWGTQSTVAATNTTLVAAVNQATTRVGAFALPANSLDAVVLATLNPGSYTVQARGAGTTTGVAIIEVYDASVALTGPKAVNVSTRANVGTGENILIAGFVVNGTVSRRMLIRGIGPTLRNFGLAANSVLPDPQLKLLDSASNTLATNDDWSAGSDAAFVAGAATAAGAFPLVSGSKDAAILIMLPPGAYTVQLSGVGTTANTGIGLLEVYDVDP